jgi:two-component system, NtrC family, nitrogen regulation sensor histidine kinase NtrY
LLHVQYLINQKLQTGYSLKQFLLRNSYLLVTAAWLVTISFIIDNYLSGNASPKTVGKNVMAHLAEQEYDFDEIAADSGLLYKLVNHEVEEEFLRQLSEKKYFLFLYTQNSVGTYNLVFWSTQVIDPLGSIAIMQGKSGFIQLSNGYYVWRKAAYMDITAIALIPIKWNYAVTNEYLKNSFTIGHNIEQAYSISQDENYISIKAKEGNFFILPGAQI